MAEVRLIKSMDERDLRYLLSKYDTSRIETLEQNVQFGSAVVDAYASACELASYYEMKYYHLKAWVQDRDRAQQALWLEAGHDVEEAK